MCPYASCCISFILWPIIPWTRCFKLVWTEAGIEWSCTQFTRVNVGQIILYERLFHTWEKHLWRQEQIDVEFWILVWNIIIVVDAGDCMCTCDILINWMSMAFVTCNGRKLNVTKVVIDLTKGNLRDRYLVSILYIPNCILNLKLCTNHISYLLIICWQAFWSKGDFLTFIFGHETPVMPIEMYEVF